MRITTNQLRRLIKEELNTLLIEDERPEPTQEMDDMHRDQQECMAENPPPDERSREWLDPDTGIYDLTRYNKAQADWFMSHHRCTIIKSMERFGSRKRTK